MREIVLDTETTGLDPKSGHRVVEIGCVEIVNRFLTGANFHRYLNPGRPMPIEAFQVHGLSDAFLSDKPTFRDVADDFIAFIADAPLVIHNASFDVSFLNHEFGQINRPTLASERIVDTLMLARRKHPGASNSLDALCQRYGIDNSRRTKHGALLDAEILAEVYAELCGGRQSALALVPEAHRVSGGDIAMSRRERRPIFHRASPEERAAHAAFVASLGSDTLWNAFTGEREKLS